MKKILMALVVGFLFIVNVNATSLELAGESNKITVKDTEPTALTLSIKDIDDGTTINGISFDFDYDKEKLSVKIPNSNDDPNVGYPFTYSNDKVLISYGNIPNGSVLLIKVTSLVEEDETIDFKLTNVKINNEDVDDITVQLNLKKENKTTTRAKSTSAALTGFKVNNNATVKPAFDKKTFEYKIYVKDTIRDVTISPSFEQNPVTMESKCTLGCERDTTLVNKIKLVTGKNEVTFTFTSEDEKDVKTYKFIIYRGPTTDGSNLLAGIEIEGFTLKEKFDKDILDYTLTVPYDTEKLTVNATPEDEAADVNIKGNENLSVGENVITITVTSTETMEKKIYNITVTRKDYSAEEDLTTNPASPTIQETTDGNNKSNNNIKLIIIIGVVSTLIIGISAYFIFFYKGKKKEEIPAAKKPKSKLQSEIIDEDKEPTSVEAALEDLMKTKEITSKDEDHFE